jgi:predicted DNA-binding transcriptional regulator YafY
LKNLRQGIPLSNRRKTRGQHRHFWLLSAAANTYQAIMENKAKTYFVKPLKIFSYRDALYLHARLGREPGKAYRLPDFDPLLAIHRFKKVEITERSYEYPTDYKFEDVFDKNFGFVKDDYFKVEVEFHGWAAKYVTERMWSADQKITKIGDDKIRLSFSASSDMELIAWILSFAEEAKVIKPKWVVEEMKLKINKLAKYYGAS